MAKKKTKRVVGIDEDVWVLLVKACGKRMARTGKFYSMTDMATDAVKDYVGRLDKKSLNIPRRAAKEAGPQCRQNGSGPVVKDGEHWPL